MYRLSMQRADGGWTVYSVLPQSQPLSYQLTVVLISDCTSAWQEPRLQMHLLHIDKKPERIIGKRVVTY